MKPPACGCDERCEQCIADLSDSLPGADNAKRVGEGVAAWMLHRFGPDTPEGREALTLLAALSKNTVEQECNCPIPTYLHDVGCPRFDPAVGNATVEAVPGVLPQCEHVFTRSWPRYRECVKCGVGKYDSDEAVHSQLPPNGLCGRCRLRAAHHRQGDYACPIREHGRQVGWSADSFLVEGNDCLKPRDCGCGVCIARFRRC
jgi:hypothetical protein